MKNKKLQMEIDELQSKIDELKKTNFNLLTEKEELEVGKDNLLLANEELNNKVLELTKIIDSLKGENDKEKTDSIIVEDVPSNDNSDNGGQEQSENEEHGYTKGKLFCSECGEEIDEDMAFCINCGHKVR